MKTSFAYDYEFGDDVRSELLGIGEEERRIFYLNSV